MSVNYKKSKESLFHFIKSEVMYLIFAYEAKFIIACCWWELHWKTNPALHQAASNKLYIGKSFATREYKITNKHNCCNWKYLLEDRHLENTLPNNKIQVITATTRNVYLTLISVRSTGNNMTNGVPMCHLLELVKRAFLQCLFFIKYFDHPYLG